MDNLSSSAQKGSSATTSVKLHHQLIVISAEAAYMSLVMNIIMAVKNVVLIFSILAALLGLSSWVLASHWLECLLFYSAMVLSCNLKRTSPFSGWKLYDIHMHVSFC